MIGFIRNDEEFTPQPLADAFDDDLDFERMWDEGLTSTSVEARIARDELHRFGR